MNEFVGLFLGRNYCVPKLLLVLSDLQLTSLNVVACKNCTTSEIVIFLKKLFLPLCRRSQQGKDQKFPSIKSTYESDGKSDRMGSQVSNCDDKVHIFSEGHKNKTKSPNLLGCYTVKKIGHVKTNLRFFALSFCLLII